jgi:hypothetical protein
MPYRLDRMMVMMGLTLVIGATPALAHGGGSHGHGRSSISAARIGASTKSFAPAATQAPPGARSVASPPPLARMLLTTVLGAPAATTKSATTSAVADPPAADPPAPAAAVPSATPSTRSGGGGSPTDLSQFNPGAQDLATSAVSAPTTANITDLAIPAASGLMTTDITTTTLFTAGSQVTTGSQVLDVNGVLVPNAATSGAVAQAPTTAAISGVAITGSQGEVIATSGGSSLIGGGASGGTMPECIAAWDKATHITKTRWRQICAVTLTEPHI